MSETYRALYRKWRPMIFEDVVGQEHVSETLKNSISANRISHAYLFCGTRGTGKTSTAKIFSRAVNCLNPQNGDPCNECEVCRGIIDGSILDVYEMDAASNSGIDNIREIRDEVIYGPTEAKYKVYIIDEAHMLTDDSFNALLKTLEEPPGHVIFILATTEPHKIPATILSRCQRFDFRRIGIDDISRRINKIVKAEGINITPDAAGLVAELADGSMRDGLSILDQCAAYAKEELRYDDIVDIVGIADKRVLFDIADRIADGNSGAALLAADGFLEKGKEVLNFIEEFIMHFRCLMICKSTDNPGELLEKTDEVTERYKMQAERFTVDRILYSITVLGDFLLQAKRLSAPRVAAEMAVLKLCMPETTDTAQALAVRVEKLENEIARLKKGGITVTQPVSGVAAGTEPAQQTADDTLETMPHIDESVKWTKWSDALKQIKQESKSLYVFLFNAEALDFGDEIELVIGNDLGYEKINTPEGKAYLGKLFSGIQGTALRVVVSKKGNLKQRDGGASVLDIAAKKELLGDKMKVIEE